MTLDWIPPLVRFADYGNNWEEYVDALHAIFRRDFLDSRATFRDAKVMVRCAPWELGKEYAFWHLISEGCIEDDRLPDLNRCARIRWPRAVIDNCDEPEIRVFENEGRGGRAVCLWVEELDYVVILGIRKKKFLLSSAYLVKPHKRARLNADYEAYKKLAPPR